MSLSLYIKKNYEQFVLVRLKIIRNTFIFLRLKNPKKRVRKMMKYSDFTNRSIFNYEKNNCKTNPGLYRISGYSVADPATFSRISSPNEPDIIRFRFDRCIEACFGRTLHSRKLPSFFLCL